FPVEVDPHFAVAKHWQCVAKSCHHGALRVDRANRCGKPVRKIKPQLATPCQSCATSHFARKYNSGGWSRWVRFRLLRNRTGSLSSNTSKIKLPLITYALANQRAATTGA